MAKEKLPTIKLKGKDYVQVKDRILFFNEEYPNGRITSTYNLSADGKTVVFIATVMPDIEKSSRHFTGHSAGPLAKDKGMEFQETVAIGRALAMMGIGVIESVASADEMAAFNGRAVTPASPAAKAWKKEDQTPHECKQCGAPAARYYGVSKAGKPFNMVQCGEKKEHVEWLDVNPEEMQLPF